MEGEATCCAVSEPSRHKSHFSRCVDSSRGGCPAAVALAIWILGASGAVVSLNGCSCNHRPAILPTASSNLTTVHVNSKSRCIICQLVPVLTRCLVCGLMHEVLETAASSSFAKT